MWGFFTCELQVQLPAFADNSARASFTVYNHEVLTVLILICSLDFEILKMIDFTTVFRMQEDILKTMLLYEKRQIGSQRSVPCVRSCWR